MKSLTQFSVLLFLSLQVQAQYSPIFTEDFSSNTHNWKESGKKPFLQVASNEYRIYNDEGKQAVVSLIDIPFDEQKIYSLETRIMQSYTPAPDGGLFGIIFNASDEKNGYIFALNGYSGFKLLQLTNGKPTELRAGDCYRLDKRGTFFNGDKVKINHENFFWKFYVNDSLAYACLALPWNGHKTGYYVSAQSGLTVKEGLLISQAEPVENPCPLSFSQQEWNDQLSRIICAAPDDFTEFQGEKDYNDGTNAYWKLKDIVVEWADDMFLTRDTTGNSNKMGKDFIIIFSCENSTDPFAMTVLFDNLLKSINIIDPDCIDLKQSKTFENLSALLLKAVYWDGEANSSSGHKVKVHVELDLNFFNDEYFSTLHVNVPNQ
jgi:hypothetical protein